MSIGQMLVWILVLPLFIVFFLFMMSLIMDIGVNDIFPVVDNTTKQVSASMGLDNSTNETIDQITDDANTLPKVINYGFTGLIFGMIIGMILIALLSERLPAFSFLTVLTVGSLVFNLALTIFGGLADWLIHEILYPVIELNMNFPIVNFYVENFQFLHFALFILVLTLNQVDLSALKARTQGSQGGSNV